MPKDEILYSIVRIHSSKHSTVVGVGFLVQNHRLVTCAHVIEDALGHKRGSDSNAPTEAVQVTFPFYNPSHYQTARVECWWPLIDEPNHCGPEDIALLQLDEPAPAESRPARLKIRALDDSHPISIYGFPLGDDKGTWADGKDQGQRLDNTRQMVADPDSPGQVVELGYSGAPVIDRQSAEVVGMMVRARRNRQLSWYVPTAMLLRACETLRDSVGMPPNMAELPLRDFVPRPKEYEKVLKLLLSEDRQAAVGNTVALKGAGGYGKTTLAREICHDPVVLDTFSDGILWLTVSQSPNLTREIKKAYRCITDNIADQFIDVDDASMRFADALGNRRCLVVLDDVWRLSDIEPLLNRLNQTSVTCLITTRITDALPRAVRISTRVDVDQMQQDESETLIRYDLPAETSPRLFELLNRLNGWPFLIRIVNGFLVERIEYGETFSQAVEDAIGTLDKVGLDAFNAADQADRYRAVSACLQLSFDHLTAEEIQRLEELAIFREDIAVPLTAVTRLWGQKGGLLPIACKQLSVKFEKLSLIQHLDLDQGNLRLHDEMRRFLFKRLGNRLTDTHLALLQSYLGEDLHATLNGPVDRILPSPSDDDYPWKYLLAHLYDAGQSELLQSLLFRFDWLWLKLNATDISGLLTDLEFGRGPDIQILQQAIRLSASAIALDKVQLPSQLMGRLLGYESPIIQNLLTQCREWRFTTWLRPLRASLNGPDGILRFVLRGHTDRVRAVALTPDGTRAVSASRDGTIRVWDVNRGIELYTFPERSREFTDVLVSANGKYVIATEGIGRIDEWVPPDVPGTLLCMRVFVWNLLSMRLEYEKNLGLARMPQLRIVGLSADGTTVCAEAHWRPGGLGPTSGRFIWDLKTGKDRTATDHSHIGKYESFSRATSHVGRYRINTEGKTVKVWDSDTDTEIYSLAGHDGAVLGVAISKDEKTIVSCSEDKTLRVWYIDTGLSQSILPPHDGTVNSVGVAVEGKKAISCAGNVINVWDASTGAVLDTVDIDTIERPQEKALLGAGLGPDGDKVYLIFDEIILVYSLQEHQELSALPYDPMPPYSGRGLPCWKLGTIEPMTTPKEFLILQTAYPRPQDGPRDHWSLPYVLPLDYRIILRIWDVKHSIVRVERVIHSSNGRGHIATMTPDGRIAVSDDALVWPSPYSYPDRERSKWHIFVWDVEGGKEPFYEGVKKSYDGCKTIEEKREGEILRLEKFNGKITALAISPDGHLIVSAAEDLVLRVWDLRYSQPIASFTSDSMFTTCAISSEGKTIIAGDSSGQVHLLRLEGCSLNECGMSIVKMNLLKRLALQFKACLLFWR